MTGGCVTFTSESPLRFERIPRRRVLNEHPARVSFVVLLNRTKKEQDSKPRVGSRLNQNYDVVVIRLRTNDCWQAARRPPPIRCTVINRYTFSRRIHNVIERRTSHIRKKLTQLPAVQIRKRSNVP
ncbi:hypothetical protein ACJJTC_000271 [Scirpophaga incertulas]